MRRHFTFLALILALTGCSPRRADRPDFVIAAAADLRFAMNDIASAFQAEHPEVTVKTTYGSSGIFYSQIENGASFDVYCSADLEYPRRLVEKGLALPDSEFQYAVGRIVIWVSNASRNQPGEPGLQSLRGPSVRHIAIANPEHAPYGKAAVASLRSLGLYDAVKEKLVYAENVSQALQFVQTQSAEIGIVALSLALAPPVRGTGRYWELPLDSYPRMEQGGVILRSSRNQPLARAFRTFVQSDRTRGVLRGYGFFMPASLQ